MLTYEADMRAVIEELEKVTTENALIIFVVGDKRLKVELLRDFRNIREASMLKNEVIVVVQVKYLMFK